LLVNDFETETSANNIAAYPNPMLDMSNIHFTSTKSESVQLVIYNLLGKVVYNKTINTQVGKNQIAISRQNLSSGLYLCKLSSDNTHYNPLKLLVK